MNNQDIQDPVDYRRTDEIDWQAFLAVKVNDMETDFESLDPAGQNQILFDISNGHRCGCNRFRHKGCIDWSLCFDVRVNGTETNFEILTDEEQEEICWRIAMDEEWQGSFDCIQPIWGEAVAYGQ